VTRIYIAKQTPAFIMIGYKQYESFYHILVSGQGTIILI